MVAVDVVVKVVVEDVAVTVADGVVLVVDVDIEVVVVVRVLLLLLLCQRRKPLMVK